MEVCESFLGIDCWSEWYPWVDTVKSLDLNPFM